MKGRYANREAVYCYITHITDSNSLARVYFFFFSKLYDLDPEFASTRLLTVTVKLQLHAEGFVKRRIVTAGKNRWSLSTVQQTQ